MIAIWSLTTGCSQPVEILLWRDAAAFVNGETLRRKLKDPLEHIWVDEIRQRVDESKPDRVEKVQCRQVLLGSSPKWMRMAHYSRTPIDVTMPLEKFVLGSGGHVEFTWPTKTRSLRSGTLFDLP